MDITDIVGDLRISHEQDDNSKIYKHENFAFKNFTPPSHNSVKLQAACTAVMSENVLYHRVDEDRSCIDS